MNGIDVPYTSTSGIGPHNDTPSPNQLYTLSETQLNRVGAPLPYLMIGNTLDPSLANNMEVPTLVPPKTSLLIEVNISKHVSHPPPHFKY